MRYPELIVLNLPTGTTKVTSDATECPNLPSRAIHPRVNRIRHASGVTAGPRTAAAEFLADQRGMP